MRRLRIAPVIGALAVAAVPAPSSAQAPAQDSVTGSGGAFVTFSFEATSGPSGEDPTGTVMWHGGGGLGPTWRGNVSCLSVSGNTAIIGFGGDYFSQLFPPRYYWVAGLLRVVDVGPGPGDSFEWVELQTSEPSEMAPPPGDPIPGPTDCSSFPSGGTLVVLDGVFHGDITVTDAQPLPTSKDQCKHGGWRNYPQFKNQGQCVEFVNLETEP
jgi:hypothetical protein